ncbi:MAG: MaoC family dehydratase N-terminal domain-containing protein [Deltaproteobacteria bacterium]|nr:MaoC family dehydratase N-terminal domain-containing protein [Deltaproteobacteria bacterium]
MNNKVDFKSPVEVGFSFEKTIRLSEEDISTFAKLSGDMNPLHHNEDIAKASRFGGIIASGPQSSALFMGTIATHIAPGFIVMGMKFECEFRAPVRPDQELKLRWVIKTVVPKPRLNGYIVTNEGGIYHNDEELMLGKGTALVVHK